MFVNSFLLPAVAGVRVETTDVYPTHQPLQIKLATHLLQAPYRKLRKTKSAAAAALEEKMTRECEEMEGKVLWDGEQP